MVFADSPFPPTPMRPSGTALDLRASAVVPPSVARLLAEVLPGVEAGRPAEAAGLRLVVGVVGYPRSRVGASVSGNKQNGATS